MPKIRIAGQATKANPTRILDAFHEFYSRIYSSPTQTNKDSISRFPNGLPILSLNTTHRNLLEAVFTEEEVMEVIKGLKKGSAPSPDALSVPYYKAFAGTLVLHMTTFFNAIPQGDSLNIQHNTTYITVIPKPDKNPEEVSNYRRPISLINNDLKILTKILANHLASFISTYIHKDQGDFIPGRGGPDQIGRAIDKSINTAN